MPRQATQRFLDLAVGEVSLVDSPANEQVFNVVKSLNQEDGDMADAANTEVTKGNTGGDSNVETVSVEVAKATNEAVEKAMAQVTQLVENIAKAATPGDPEDTDVSKADGEGDEGVEKGLTKEQKAYRMKLREKLEKKMAAAGVKGDALKSAVDVALRTVAGEGAFKPGSSAEPPVKKNSEGGEGGADVSKGADAPTLDQATLIQETLKAIQTGLAGATHATQTAEAVKAAIKALQDLEKAMTMQQVPANDSPSTTTPTSPQFGASGLKDITKGLEGIKEALQSVQEVTKGLATRVEDIEKTRAPSTSGGGGDETTTTQTTKKSMWSGLL